MDNVHSSRVMCLLQIKELAFQRVHRYDMPFAYQLIGSWSMTEGRGCFMHDHIVPNRHNHPRESTTAQLGAVAIPSAHHTYSSVSKLVACIPEQARRSVGPEWVVSTAPVEGKLIMEFCG